MSANKQDTAVLDLEQVGSSGLQFTTSTGVTPSSTTHTFSGNVPDSALDDDDKNNLIHDDGDEAASPADDGPAPPPKTTNYNFMTLAFYRQFFDVSTSDVQERLLWSLTPRPAATAEFVRKRIRPNPDLYGPFWVCVTLIFSVAISGNVASYLQAAVSHSDSVKGFRWHYDFHKVTLAATAVFAYAWLVPAALYMAMWAKAENSNGGGDSEGIVTPSPTQVSLVELLCVYGYSLSVFIPVSVLWTIQSSALQWFLVGAAFLLSGSVLVFALWNNSVKDSGVRKNFGFVLIAVVISLHLLLAMGFMLYFFHVPAHGGDAPVTPGGNVTVPEVPAPSKQVQLDAAVKNETSVKSQAASDVKASEKLVKSPDDPEAKDR